MAGWTTPCDLLREELVQRTDEGCAIPTALREQIAAIDREKDAWNEALITPLYDALMALPEDPDLAAAEPNDLAAIRALRPDGPRAFRWAPSDAELHDKLHGAWTGRCVGCALGKPVEGMGMRRDPQGRLAGRRAIRAYLEARADWPLANYFSLRDAGDGQTIHCHPSCREQIAYMEPDDDIHYSLIGLGVLEQHGPAFTWQHVAQYWLAHLPMTAICTAETQAILNLQNRSCRGYHIHATPAWTRRYRNPYREWIGAQIRADGWAFCTAGNPQLAAEFAWRDAHWTHERNGIYGEMMAAAMIAAAFVITDPAELIHIGLSEIPRDCRLARWVRQCLTWLTTEPDWESAMTRLEAALPDMHVVHTINNALICLIALHYGRLHTTHTPAIAVMAGMDTDCNGATTGSIVGAIAGRSAFGGILADQLHDTVRPQLLGFQQVTMTDLAHRTATIWKTLHP